MKKTLVCLALGALLAMPLAYAQPKSMNIGGAGARAMGMGGAFTAIADDATATFYNPAGLAQLKRPEVTAVGYFASKQTVWDVTFTDHPEFNESSENTANNFSLNFGSIIYPLNPGGRNFVLAGSGHMIIDMYSGEAWAFENSYDRDLKETGAESHEMNQKGGIYSYSLFGACEVSKRLLLGFGAGIFAGSYNQTKIEEFKSSETSKIQKETRLENNSFGGGPQFTIGTLVKVNRKLKIGAMIKPPSVMTMEGESRSEDYYSWESSEARAPDITNGELDIPLMVAGGVSYRPRDLLTLACDYHLLQWSESKMRDEQGNEKMGMVWKDSGQVHAGLEYLAPIFAGYPTPVRLGFYSYPMALNTSLQSEKLMDDIYDYVDDHPSVDKDDLPPYLFEWEQRTRYFYTLGFGVITANTVFDIAMEYSPFEETEMFGGDNEEVPVTATNNLLKLYFSGIYKF